MGDPAGSAPSPAPEEGGTRPPWALLGVVAVLGLGALFVWLEGGSQPPLVRGSEAPAFELPALAGEEPVRLDSLRGKAVLVNFWATWCKPCEDEIPAMGRLYRALEGVPFELLAISVDEKPEPVQAFRERLGIPFPILLDPGQGTARRYQTTGFPESVLVDPEGRVVERYVGPRDWDAPVYEERIRALVAARGR